LVSSTWGMAAPLVWVKSRLMGSRTKPIARDESDGRDPAELVPLPEPLDPGSAPPETALVDVAPTELPPEPTAGPGDTDPDGTAPDSTEPVDRERVDTGPAEEPDDEVTDCPAVQAVSNAIAAPSTVTARKRFDLIGYPFIDALVAGSAQVVSASVRTCGSRSSHRPNAVAFGSGVAHPTRPGCGCSRSVGNFARCAVSGPFQPAAALCWW